MNARFGPALRRRLSLLCLMAGLAAASLAAELPPTAAGPAQGTPAAVSLASFNIRAFSDRSRDDAELREIAALIAPYDLVAIQETRDIVVLERLVHVLSSEFGLEYAFSDSPRLKSGGGELYAVVWRPDRIEALGPLALVPDPDDVFIREPAWELFRVNAAGGQGGFDFCLINYHALYGGSLAARRAELARLGDVLSRVGSACRQALPGESDILLFGDFNAGCSDPVFDALRQAGMQPVIPGLGTTIKDHPYDNIWYFPAATREFTGRWGIVRFDETEFDGNDQRASQAVSDHRPIWAAFSSGPDDD